MNFIIVLAFLVFSGCVSSNRSAHKTEETLTSNTWILKTIYQHNNIVQIKEPVAFITSQQRFRYGMFRFSHPGNLTSTPNS